MKSLLTFILYYVNVLKQGVNMSTNRPKHSFSKKQEEIKKEDIVHSEAEYELKSIGYGIYKDVSGDWMVAKLNFDPVSGQAKVVERLSTGHGDKNGAQDRFKIEVAKNIFG